MTLSGNISNLSIFFIKLRFIYTYILYMQTLFCNNDKKKWKKLKNVVFNIS